MAAGPVLVVTEIDDVTANMVIAELNRRGVPVIRCNPADIGEDLLLTAHLGRCPTAPSGMVRTPSRIARLEEVRAVYWRRPTWPDFAHLGDQDARFAAAQTRHGLGGTRYALPQARYVNHPLRDYAAEYKPLQLAAAQRLGLAVPPTLISNDLQDITAFVNDYAPVVYKALRWTPYRRPDGTGMTTWTQPVTAEELDESVTVVPHLFQARVEKETDVRVVVIGRRVFATRIDSELLDWRRDYRSLSYQPLTVPEPVAEALVRYLEHFAPASGSFDLAWTARAGSSSWSATPTASGAGWKMRPACH